MLGGGLAPPALARAIAASVEDALTRPVDMSWLKDDLSTRIAAATGAEAGCVTSGAAAGIVLSVAACVAGESREAVHQLPDGGRKPVVLQAGHDIDFGAPVIQMIRLGGGTVVVAGSPTRVTSADVERSLAWAAALLYVQSHHVAARERVPLDRCIALAHAAGIPVIVDAAAEQDLRSYVAAGADLVIYSGGKALGGLSSSGFVAGRDHLIRAVRAQERGIGRPMKVGPEQLLSVAIALDLYESLDRGQHEAVTLDAIMSAALGISGAEFEIVDDEAGRPIRRVEVRTPRAIEVVESLRRNAPPIYVRAHHAREGRFAIDPRNLRAEDAEVVVDALRRALQER
jgi:L-seryl-tRNA(Ser) seleniumtransferase/D-glucosaminate-6-phosphate ammonia-lyase